MKKKTIIRLVEVSYLKASITYVGSLFLYSIMRLSDILNPILIFFLEESSRLDAQLWDIYLQLDKHSDPFTYIDCI